MKFNKVFFALAMGSAFSSGVWANNYAIEARGDAMGGVGVVSGTYLTAPFYNPALTAIYRRNDDAGMITPSIGFNYNDPDQLVDQIDSIASLIRAVPSNPAALDAALNQANNSELNFDFGGVLAMGIPNRFLSATIYGKAYTESFVTPKIDTSTSDPLSKAQNSIVDSVTVGVTEVGISFGKYQTFMGQHVAFGVTPKLQRVYTYSYVSDFATYDTSDIRANEEAETVFNLDAGVLWFLGPFRAGVSAKNLIGRDISTKNYTYTTAGGKSWQIGYDYSMRPQYTVGAGIVADYFTFSVDYDLNKAKKFSSFDDDTQMLRAGFEVDMLRQLQLRGGYIINTARDTDNTITAGIGLSPLNLFELDISARYSNPNAMGASINFLATY